MRLLLLLLLLAQTSFGQITGRVVGVHDGDTFTLLDSNNNQIKVRLRSIDCPEMDQPFGKHAKKYTSDKAFNKTVTLIDIGHDRYKRTLATVILPSGDTLNHIIIRDGYAWHYLKYDKSSKLQELEQQARKDKLGLWREDAIAPWDWR